MSGASFTLSADGLAQELRRVNAGFGKPRPSSKQVAVAGSEASSSAASALPTASKSFQERKGQTTQA